MQDWSCDSYCVSTMTGDKKSSETAHTFERLRHLRQVLGSSKQPLRWLPIVSQEAN